MKLPLSSAVAERLDWLPSVGSTNDALRERATGPDASAWPDLSVVATDTQTQGRGRLGRTWTAPAGKCLAVSVLLRQPIGSSVLPPDSLGWLPLMAGAAMTQVVRSLIEGEVGHATSVHHHPVASLKWPNDVLIDGAKVSGILSELVPSTGVIVGAGLNISLTESELPVSTATSLLLSGVQHASLDAALAGYIINLSRLYRDFVRFEGDAVQSGLHALVTALCGTLGSPVLAELPGGEVVSGIAREIDELGRIGIDRDSDGWRVVVAAGDITHLKV
ncbi:biotin--[acetyl-CoA-carboxylase] ligase [Agreia pratensis]|uniref:BirA family transcriptional regulator, biotin operon repressor / biotin-[acetyl-CoA-carboxylase] ligase n=1 Tax=Agreia pratensis TaxID=150121 RepID=A0A1X7IEK5_9MICO|nr:biotin--[acetyl-CoA-carboxylase] ligase [Agreia pratensis]SMG12659.1 BirA family transcriptional regulator, biotin operon repressor / biotin-[acetyl-CoA-carboxylase] ligase [Agreia pratensis]